ncbi:hypothetical protein PIB30_062414 [Stylosanthes scabra]|uniref:Uncharacterized protein n=1 Tax=Stylosanthes scabra TaxID=79078 RepID=A0ABU6UN98_9FABA|nr:hypothetical protein [Stylosanthes scabra]
MKVNAFTDSAFKGNPAAVCLLEEEKEQEWLQSVAAEFNVPVTCYLTTIISHSNNGTIHYPRFNLRWFTHVTEVNICAHATLAAAHTLFSSGLVESNNVIEFVTRSGILSAKRIQAILQNGSKKDNGFYIELDFPAYPITEPNLLADETSQIYGALNNCASIIDIKRTQILDDLLVVVSSGEVVRKVEPKFDAILKIPGRGVIVSGIAPRSSGFDFYSRFFCPKDGVNEDPVCGSAHCGLASYWSKKLGKCDFNAYQASARGGSLKIHIDNKKKRVLLRGKAVTIMEGCLLV